LYQFLSREMGASIDIDRYVLGFGNYKSLAE
jgi:hypothetical protein